MYIKEHRPIFFSSSPQSYARGAVAAAIRRCGIHATYTAILDHPDRLKLLDALATVYIAPHVQTTSAFELVTLEPRVNLTVAISFYGALHRVQVIGRGGLYCVAGWVGGHPIRYLIDRSPLLSMLAPMAVSVGERMALEYAREELELF